MWIPGQYIGIWRKHKLRLYYTNYFMLIWALPLFIVSCVVADEIEFYDKINMPPSVDALHPENDIINFGNNGTTRDFTITIWDPDVEDASLYDGRIWVIEQLNSSHKVVDDSSCDSKTILTPADEQYDGGVLVTFVCSATFQVNTEEKTDVIVRIEVSDRGYLSGGQLPDNANTASRNWTWQLSPEDQNGF